MRAYVLHHINDLRQEEIDEPALMEDEVLVKVGAFGICGSDIPRIYRTGTYSYPLIPGHEFSGTVIKAGERSGLRWLGKRVGVFPLIPCKSCAPCANAQYELCRRYSYLGSRTDGGFSEYVKAPAWNLIELPSSVSFEDAAMLEPMAVAVHAIRRADPKKDSQIVVCGLGTIGMFVLMFLMESGIKDILALGNKDLQRRTALRLGLSEERYCDVRMGGVDQWLYEQTGEKGADVFFDCAGRNEVLCQAVGHTIVNGTILLVGNPASDMNLDKELYWKILRNQLTLRGIWNSSFTHDRGDDWHYALERLAAGRIRPGLLISHRFSFDEVERGLSIMRDKSEDYIKVIGVF